MKKAKLDKNEREQVGQFYIDLLEDPRFIFTGGKKWRIREFLTSTEIANYENSLYDFGEQIADTYLDKDTNFKSTDKEWLDNEMFLDEEELKEEFNYYQKDHKIIDDFDDEIDDNIASEDSDNDEEEIGEE